MKIFLLEHPRKIESSFCNDIANTPLSSSLITPSIQGNLIAKNHDVMVCEGFMGNKNYEEIKREIAYFQPEILGVHMIYQWDNHKDLKVFLKELHKETSIKIVVYGFYSSFAYEDILKTMPEIDGVVIGEPEPAFIEIAAGAKMNAVHSVAYVNEKGIIVKNQISILKDLDTLAHPVRSLELLSMREINIEGSRGCYNNCIFCYINNYYGKKCLWRGHSIDYICQEIEMLMNCYGKNRFYFVDPNFFGPGKRGKQRGLALAKRLKVYDIKFGIEARVNDIEEESLQALVDAGLEEILIGLESGSQKSLNRLEKHTTVEQNEEALRILRKVGIEPNIGFIMFEPSSDLEDIYTNFAFLKRNKLLENLKITSNMLYHNQILLQGSECYRTLPNLSSPAPYHVVLPYDNKQVGILANVMRKITNVLFTEIAPLWSCYMEESQELLEIYSQINHIYVDFFETILTNMRNGNISTNAELEELVSEKSKSIISLVEKAIILGK